MVPNELKQLDQWVVWSWEPDDRGKPTKPPSRADGQGHADSTDPTTWTTAKDAYAKWKSNGWAGLGFVVTAADPYCGVDCDHCRDPETGTIDAWAQQLVDDFVSYTEITPTKTGIRIWTKAVHGGKEVPHKRYLRDAPNPQAAVEIYDRERYFTTTGDHLPGTPEAINEGQEALGRLVARLWPQKTSPSSPAAQASPSLQAREIIDILSRAFNAPKFERLMAGDCSDYPSGSEADLGLLGMIFPFYTEDQSTALEIVRSSGLWDDKWERRDYQERNFRKLLESDSGERYQGPLAGGEIRHGHKQVKQGVPQPRILPARELQTMTIPEPCWAVPGILVDGLVMLAAKAKIGKSWLALDWAIAVASGGKATGAIETDEGDVLYLALEDNDRRLQQRMRQLLKGRTFPSRLYLATEWPKIDESGIRYLHEWLVAHPDARLIIIDVWKRVRQTRQRNANLYDEDYEHLRELKTLADQHRTSVVVVHHTRKAGGEDVFDEISGSGGIAAALDSILVLHRSRSEADAELWVTGRDVEESKLALRFELGKWSLLGNAAEVKKSRERREILEFVVAETRNGNQGITPSVTADSLGKPRANVKVLMAKMAREGDLKSLGNGKYTPEVTGNPDPLTYCGYPGYREEGEGVTRVTGNRSKQEDGPSPLLERLKNVKCDQCQTKGAWSLVPEGDGAYCWICHPEGPPDVAS